MYERQLVMVVVMVLDLLDDEGLAGTEPRESGGEGNYT